MKTLIVRAAAMLFLVLAWAWPSLAGEPLVIGVGLPLSGKYAELGRMHQRGYLLWQQHVNQAGGVMDRPVDVLIMDDESDPDKARAIYADLMEEENVDFVFGPYSSATTLAVAPLTRAAGYPLLAAGAAAEAVWEKGGGSVFGVLAPAGLYADAFMDLLASRGISRVAVLHARDPFSASVADGAGAAAARNHLDLVLAAAFPKDQRRLEPLMDKARRARAQAVVVCGHFNESVDALRALKNLDWRPEAFFASVGPAMPAFAGAAGPGSEQNVFSSSQFEAKGKASRPDRDRFVKDFTNVYKEPPSYQAAAAYASGQLLAKAVDTAGSLDRDKVARALARMKTATVLGDYGVDASGKQTRHRPVVIQWRDGRRLVVWPRVGADAEPVFGPDR